MNSIPCPVCKTSGLVAVPADGFIKAGSNVPVMGRCNLCWGDGYLPPLEACQEPIHHNHLALRYWECRCISPGDGSIANYHPDLHDFCPKCHAQQDDCMSAIPMLVQDWLTDLGAENIEIIWVEQDEAEPDPDNLQHMAEIEIWKIDSYYCPPNLREFTGIRPTRKE